MLMFGFLFINGCKNADLQGKDENPDTIKTEARVDSNNNNPNESGNAAHTQSVDNLFFFKPDVTQMRYMGKFLFEDAIQKDIVLNINKTTELNNGIIYELKLDSIEGMPEERLILGYFFVQRDKIYKIEYSEDNLKKIKVSKQLPDNIILVCQEKEIKDVVTEKNGYNHYLEVKGDVIEYHSYNSQTNTGFFETIIWEKEKGIVSYRSGFGADRDLIELQLYDREKNFDFQESEGQTNMILDKEEFYGIWEFTKPVTIYGLSPEKTIEFMGKQFTYMQDFCRCGKSGLNNPEYSIEILEKENFNEDLKIFLDNNSIEKDYIHRIKIFKDKENEWNGLGNEFYKIDDKIIVSIDGELYELKRIFSGKTDNYLVDKNSIQTGQKIGTLTIKSIDKVLESVNDITFSGEIHVKGIYEWCDTGDGYGCIITLDESSRGSVPVFEDFANEKSIRINNTEMAKELLPKETGKIEIVLDNYSIGEREIMMSADVVRVIKVD